MKKVMSFFNMKKLVLGALACAALVLLMPGEAKAAVAGWEFTDGTSSYDGTGYSWERKESGVDDSDPDTWHVLTLNGVTVNASDDNGIEVCANTKIVLNGENSITVSGNGNGIKATGNLMITGSGSLTINTSINHGIEIPESYTDTGDIYIIGTNVSITCGKDWENTEWYDANGLQVSRHTVIKNSELVIKTLGGRTSHCIDIGYSRTLHVEPSSNLKVKFVYNGAEYEATETTEQMKTIDGNKKSINYFLYDYNTKTVEITYKNSSSNPGNDPGNVDPSNPGNDPENQDPSNPGNDPETQDPSDPGSDPEDTDTTKPGNEVDKTEPTKPESTVSDKKSDDKKNESSPFHKFETSSIKEAKASGTIDATGGWKSFDRGTLNELSKLDKDISVTYDFDGHTYCVVVPKGFDPQKLVNEEGYCGFLYLAKVYGAVMIK